MWFSEVRLPLTLNVAVTEVSLDSVTLHVLVPEQPPPDHPPNVDPVFGVAVSVTAVPLAKLAMQVEPQLIPDGELLTDPPPAPASCTVNRGPLVAVLNVAVTEVLLDSVTLHVLVPEQPPPDQPTKVDPAFGVAVSVTAVPLAKFAVQVEPQVIPEGALLTDPPPVPASCTVN